MLDYKCLLNEYRKLWKNRPLFVEEGSESEAILKEAIMREMKDENAHPRVRKNPMDKFYLATKRIMESELADESKLALMRLHIELMMLMK
ncbi:hypothetical protein F7731_00895 [Cytobacillus depressus]|uniref:Uncharacterized protein n=1 Tax=Cytobacillus depressus TaxID=1602942 RepID=A0A6L3V924_9BACI|nr:hypothetical protein [Cytobacillus depressus]KAB2338161.1 hypothetical protein F7731_00895 [Cytobacillus depressus]